MRRAVWLAAMVLVGARAAPGYELLRVNNHPCARFDRNLFWPPATATVSLAPLPEPYRALANEALQRWNLSLSRFRFHTGSGPACTRDGVAALAIADTPCGLQQFGDALAITRSVWKQDTGELVDADVTFNANSFIVGNQAAFRQVAMHELGHVLGLDHSDSCGASGDGTLMKSVLVPPLLDAPQADDVDGAEFIYPSDSNGGGTPPAGANSCAIVPPRPGATPAAAWLVLPLLFWRRARRRLGRLTE